MCGSLDSYLAKQLSDKDSETWHCVFRSLSAWQLVQDTAIKFYQFVEKEFPPDPSLSLPQRMCRKLLCTGLGDDLKTVQTYWSLSNFDGPGPMLLRVHFTARLAPTT